VLRRARGRRSRSSTSTCSIRLAMPWLLQGGWGGPRAYDRFGSPARCCKRAAREGSGGSALEAYRADIG
jgi:hypothetical protein